MIPNSILNTNIQRLLNNDNESSKLSEESEQAAMTLILRFSHLETRSTHIPTFSEATSDTDEIGY